MVPKASLNPTETRRRLAVHLYLQEFGLVTRRWPQRAGDSTLQAALSSGAGAASQSERPSSRIHTGSRPQMLLLLPDLWGSPLDSGQDRWPLSSPGEGGGGGHMAVPSSTSGAGTRQG